MKRRIFIEGEEELERAYIGWQGEDITSLIGVKMGYKNSADILLDKAIEEGLKNRIDILDTFIFPILFLYRHSIEISLKLIYKEATGKLFDEHNILKLWNKIDKEVIRMLIDKNAITIEEEVLNEVRELLEELHGNTLKELQGTDKNGDVWRYLINKKGNLYFNECKFIDYPNLKETINYIYSFLDYIYDAIYYNKNYL